MMHAVRSALSVAVVLLMLYAALASAEGIAYLGRDRAGGAILELDDGRSITARLPAGE